MGAGVAVSVFGVFLVVCSIVVFVMGWHSSFYDRAQSLIGLSVLVFVVGVVLIFVGWVVHEHNRNNPARPPAGGPAGPQNRPGPPAGIG